MLESLFNKVAGQKACNFIKKKPQHRCFPVKYAKSLRTLFLLQNTSGGCFCNFHKMFFTGPNAIESLSKFLKQSPLKNCYRPASLLKETPAQLFSCNFCKIFQNTYFKEHFWMPAPKVVSQ